jgi:hypothetical protein
MASDSSDDARESGGRASSTQQQAARQRARFSRISYDDEADLAILRQVMQEAPFARDHGEQSQAWEACAQAVAGAIGNNRNRLFLLNGSKTKDRVAHLLKEHADRERVALAASGIDEPPATELTKALIDIADMMGGYCYIAGWGDLGRGRRMRDCRFIGSGET